MKKILLLMLVALPFLLISCGDDKDEPNRSKKHEFVDLGLPSGTLWATCNVGANNPEEYGSYFAWGETAPKKVYTWETYKWCNGSWDSLTKYCTNSIIGIVDNKTELDLEDDAAYANWGTSWRIPSKEQIHELCVNCDWQCTQRNGVNGQLVTGSNGNTMFLPATGFHNTDSLGYAGSVGGYWSRTHNVRDAIVMGFGNGYYGDIYAFSRFMGFPVRAVYIPQN